MAYKSTIESPSWAISEKVLSDDGDTMTAASMEGTARDSTAAVWVKDDLSDGKGSDAVRVGGWGGVVWHGMCDGMVWYGMVWYGMAWYAMLWYGMLWYGMHRYMPVWDVHGDVVGCSGLM